ncbi:MAG: recombinase family protein, partial [Prevotella sp.]|nr:recombinase family protein [Prevotella sp.]
LRPGDRLIIASIDRLGRDCYETIDQWRIITCKKMVQIIVMDMDFLEDLQTKDVFGRMLGDIMLYIMSYFAQLEREKIITRQKEGIAAAKARGVKFGRKAIGKPRKFDAILKQWRAKEITTTKAARLLGVSRPTFLKWTKK